MITRRRFFGTFAVATATTVGLSGYAFGVEPLLRLRVARYRVTPPDWPRGLRLTLAVLADIHACEPWMTPARVGRIAEATNALGADAVLLLGDYVTARLFASETVRPEAWARALARLQAPLGVHAILGNHDWWADHAAQRRGSGPVVARLALEDAGLPVYENDVVRYEKDGRAVWFAGLGDQLAYLPRVGWRRDIHAGADDLAGTLAKVTDDAPVILMAHEPDIFPSVPDRVALTLAGHTHGGQVRLFGYSPVVPSAFGNRYAYGHIVEQGDAAALPIATRGAADRHLIVSGGLGCSVLPVRFGVPPEIVLVEIGRA